MAIEDPPDGTVVQGLRLRECCCMQDRFVYNDKLNAQYTGYKINV